MVTVMHISSFETTTFLIEEKVNMFFLWRFSGNFVILFTLNFRTTEFFFTNQFISHQLNSYKITDSLI